MDNRTFIKEYPVLSLLDNHYTYCSLNAYNFCKERGIILLTIPPHTLHRVQPLDVTFYSPLKTPYNSECDNLMSINPREKNTPNIVAGLFNKAFGSVATIKKVTEIFPIYPDVFNAEDFAPFENLLTTNLNEPIPENNQLGNKITGERAEDVRQQSFKADTNKNERRQNMSFGE
ncbi:hypothetical protein HUJ04_000499, partial [Dendroctonus ponderosae]